MNNEGALKIRNAWNIPLSTLPETKEKQTLFLGNSQGTLSVSIWHTWSMGWVHLETLDAGNVPVGALPV